jgi:hypothetical protein
MMGIMDTTADHTAVITMGTEATVPGLPSAARCSAWVLAR